MRVIVTVEDPSPGFMAMVAKYKEQFEIEQAEPKAEPKAAPDVARMEFEEVVKDEATGEDAPTIQECQAVARRIDLGKHRAALSELLKELGAGKVKDIEPGRRAEFIKRAGELADAS